MDLQEQLKAVNATLSEALERGDVTATTALFTDDAVCITPNFPTARGHAALVKLLRSWGGTPRTLNDNNPVVFG